MICDVSFESHLSVPAEAEHDVVDLVLEYKVVVIICGSQLNVLDDELVQHYVYGDYRFLQLVVVHLILF